MVATPEVDVPLATCTLTWFFGMVEVVEVGFFGRWVVVAWVACVVDVETGVVVVEVAAGVVVGEVVPPGEDPSACERPELAIKKTTTKAMAKMTALVRSRVLLGSSPVGGASSGAVLTPSVSSPWTRLANRGARPASRRARRWSRRPYPWGPAHLPVWRSWKRRRFVIVRSWVRVPPPARREASRTTTITDLPPSWLARRQPARSTGVMSTPPQSTLKEFQGFILRGNVVDLAVAVAIGAAFTAVITAFTKSFITPLVAALLPHRNGGAFASLNFAIGKTTFDVAGFITALITFLITAVIIFFFVVKPTQLLMRRFGLANEAAAPHAPCLECLTEIPVAATRCSACTAQLGHGWAPAPIEESA